jgi:GNAT superfamily N-acetyltransferase
METLNGYRTEEADAERDGEAIAPLLDAYRVFYGEPPDLEAARTFIRQRFAKRDTQFFVARANDGGLLGFAHLLLSIDTLSLRPIGILEDIYVLEAARGQGIGGALLDAAAAYARAHWARAIDALDRASESHRPAPLSRQRLRTRSALPLVQPLSRPDDPGSANPALSLRATLPRRAVRRASAICAGCARGRPAQVRRRRCAARPDSRRRRCARLQQFSQGAPVPGFSPRSHSATIFLANSCASARLAGIVPEGPRFAQPTQYNPSSMRPSVLRSEAALGREPPAVRFIADARYRQLRRQMEPAAVGGREPHAFEARVALERDRRPAEVKHDLYALAVVGSPADRAQRLRRLARKAVEIARARQ